MANKKVVKSASRNIKKQKTKKKTSIKMPDKTLARMNSVKPV